MPRTGLTPDPHWRSAVLDHIAGHPDRPVKLRALARELRVPDSDYTTFRQIIRGMLDEGILVLGPGRSLRLPDQTGQVVGVFRASRRGFGFLERPGHPALYVDERRTAGALDGDTVAARVVRRRGVRVAPEAEVVRIVRRAPLRWIGVLEPAHRGGLVRPSGRTPLPAVHITDPAESGAHYGEVVAVEPDPETLHSARVRGRIRKRLGAPDDGRTWIRAIIHRMDLPDTFPVAVEHAARRAAAEFDPGNLRGREDLRPLTTITIDPADARDFDDAISVERLPGHRLRLGVHIADVGHFVPAGGPIDAEARRRGTSVYFPGLVLPMLPPALSNDVCSLRPGEPRFTQSVFLTYDDAGEVVERRFCRSVICSRARLSYPQVTAALESGQTTGLSPDVLALLQDAERLARRIQRRRIRNGMIVLSVPEVEIQLDVHGKVQDARPRDAGFSHTMIEMFMVETNEAVSRGLREVGVPHLHRVHPPPDPAAADTLAPLAPILGHTIHGTLTHSSIQRLLAEVRRRPEEPAVHYTLLRALAQASYSPGDIGHFALACRDYCHFTSPIRRYPDLTVHRLFPALLPGGRGWLTTAANEIPSEAELAELGNRVSALERRAQAAEWDADNRLLLLWMMSRVGEHFDAIITGVASFGVFVQVEQCLAEGVIRVIDFGPDDWRYDRGTAAFHGLRTSRTVHLGQRVRVQLVAVDELRQELTFVPDTGLIGRTAVISSDSKRRRGQVRES